MKIQDLERLIEINGFIVREKRDGMNMYVTGIQKKNAIYVIYGSQNYKYPGTIDNVNILKLSRYVPFLDVYFTYYFSFVSKYKKLLEKKKKLLGQFPNIGMNDIESILSAA